MRQIKFRAKTINEVEWVYSMTISHGTVDRKRNCLFFEVQEDKWKGVIPETLGQFTGLADCNGKEIYEGDILSTDLSKSFCEVVFRNGCFMLRLNDGGEDFYDIFSPLEDDITQAKYHEVIGNIYDNPELIKRD